MHTVDLDLNLEHVAKVEGAANVTVRVRGGKVEAAQYEITEYKRFYTRGIEGKALMAVPQLVSRICGTCSNAHILASIEACERAIGLKPTPQTMLLRRLTMDGLNVRDHALHLYLFALPDIVGKDNFLSLDENDPVQHQMLHDAFDIKAAGNALAELVSGRSVHATFPTVGGFLKVPTDRAKVDEVIKKLEAVRPAALRTIKIFVEAPFHLDRKTDYMALMPEGLFSFIDGDIICSWGDPPVKEADFRSHIEHVVQMHSTASAYSHKGRPFMVGSLARLNLAKDRLHPKTKESIPEVLKMFPSTDIFHNNLAQAVEILHCIDEAVEILRNTEFKPEPPVKAVMKAGVGVGVVEAPRGTLYHKVETDEKGNVVKGEIIVPTNQNQLNIEADIMKIVQDNLDKMDKDQIAHEIEKLIRAYDPCMSCAAHFLKVNWDIS
jgi:coenzyme F420-reducing hydrogenase alpha subunit